MKAEAKPAEEAHTGETQQRQQEQPAAGDSAMADADAKPSTSRSAEAAQGEAGPTLEPDGRPAKKTRQGALLAMLPDMPFTRLAAPVVRLLPARWWLEEAGLVQGLRPGRRRVRPR